MIAPSIVTRARYFINIYIKIFYDYNAVRAAACGNVKATSRAILRAKNKRFLPAELLNELQEDRFRKYQFTLRGEVADIDLPHFEERLLIQSNNQLAIYSSPRQLQLLKVIFTLFEKLSCYR